VALLIAFPSIVLKTPTAPVNIDNVEIPMPPKDDGAPERE